MPLLTLKKLESHLYGAADILRKGGLDHSEFRDFIYGFIFMRRCSDVFEVERDKVLKSCLDRGSSQDEAEELAEDSNMYSQYFVPKDSRWESINGKLHKEVANGLNKALQGLAYHNTILQGITDTINFAKEFGKKSVPDKTFRELISHFNKYRLRDEDFEHSDLLGSAYEYLIYMFAESGGKKGGDFYTPREVVRMMVRMADPKPGMEVYDPCCGSGGMLAFSKRHIVENGGDGTNLFLSGQDYSGSSWVVSKMNMILHGITERVKIENEDTLTKPQHLEQGSLRRFDVVLSNPPFGINWSKEGMIFPERFRFGECPQTGKKAEFMFIQHMIATLKDDGIAITVAPHGVLFRGGAEENIRTGILDEDLLEAVISVGPNLFYGTGIPGCILVLRSRKESKHEERRGKVLFINADKEYEEGRAMNVLRPRHAEKILRTFNGFDTVEGFSRVVDLAEIKDEHGYNLNVRRYVDNSPPPEPHEVRCHLHGGIPKAEVDDIRPRLARHGLDPDGLLDSVDERTMQFKEGFREKETLSEAIKANAGVVAKEQALRDAFSKWWDEHSSELASMPGCANLMSIRVSLLKSFEEKLTPVGLLDTFEVAGVVAGWWYDSFDEFRSIQSQGFGGLIDGWILTIRDFIEDKDAAKDKTFDPLHHKLVTKLCPDYLKELEDTEASIAGLKEEKEAFERGEHLEDSDEEYDGKDNNYAKEKEEARKLLVRQIKEPKAHIKKLESGAGVKDGGSIKAQIKLGNDVTELEAELARLKKEVEPVEEEIASLVETLKPYKEIKDKLKAENAKLKTLKNSLVENLEKRRTELSDDECRDLVLDLIRGELVKELERFVQASGTVVVFLVQKWLNKYHHTLIEIEGERDNAKGKLDVFLKELGYAE